LRSRFDPLLVNQIAMVRPFQRSQNARESISTLTTGIITP
jgi:hypothetical protein